MTDGIVIAPASTPDDLAGAAALFRAYAASLDVDLAYQDFAGELAALPGRYAPPTGALLLARDAAGLPVGCVAMRALGADSCEMKRLYVAPQGRGAGLGRRLMTALIAEARRLGHREMLLDTLPSMAAAQTLYRSAGFVATEPYYDSPIAGTAFLRLPLA